jgi:hypothetical protein
VPESKRVQPKIPVELKQKLVEELAPEMGDNPSTITRNIIYSWLFEHRYLDKMLEKEKR